MFNSMNYVYEVYKERSFSKAAANLYISQPSLSATVKKVEERIGAPIFDLQRKPDTVDGMRPALYQGRRRDHGYPEPVRELSQ